MKRSHFSTWGMGLVVVFFAGRLTSADEPPQNAPLRATLEAHVEPQLAALLLQMAQAARAPTITVELEDVDVRAALEIITRQGNGNLIVTPEVQGNVRISLRSVSWREAVTYVAACVGARVVQVESPSNAEILRVESDEPELVARTFVVGDGLLCAALRGPHTAIFGKKRWADAATPDRTPEPTPAALRAEEVENTLSVAVSKYGSLQIRFDGRTCSFLVKDTLEGLERIALALRNLGVQFSQTP